MGVLPEEEDEGGGVGPGPATGRRLVEPGRPLGLISTLLRLDGEGEGECEGEDEGEDEDEDQDEDEREGEVAS